jgi:hypothetical protein
VAKQFLVNPIFFGLALLALGAVALAVPGQRFAVALALLLVWVIVTTLVLASQPNWWVRALGTLLMGPIVMLGLIYIAEAYQEKSIGEGALALLGPLMAHWVLVPLSGIIRLVVRALKERRPDAGT